MGLERTVSYFEVTGSKQASTVMGSESTVMGSESTVMGSESTVMGSDTAVTGSGTVPVPGKPQDACCPSRGLQSDLMVGVACVKGSATPARLEASSCRSPSRYAARAHGTPCACYLVLTVLPYFIVFTTSSSRIHNEESMSLRR